MRIEENKGARNKLIKFAFLGYAELLPPSLLSYGGQDACAQVAASAIKYFCVKNIIFQ